LKEYQN